MLMDAIWQSMPIKYRRKTGFASELKIFTLPTGTTPVFPSPWFLTGVCGFTISGIDPIFLGSLSHRPHVLDFSVAVNAGPGTEDKAATFTSNIDKLTAISLRFFRGAAMNHVHRYITL